MSDPHVVMVTIDFAPWDSDVEAEPRLFGFNGPEEAQAFKTAAQSVARDEAKDAGLIIGVYDPEPLYKFGDSAAGLEFLDDWIGEAE